MVYFPTDSGQKTAPVPTRQPRRSRFNWRKLVWLGTFSLAFFTIELGLMWWRAESSIKLAPAVPVVTKQKVAAEPKSEPAAAQAASVEAAVSIKIAKIGVSAPIIPVGVTKEGNMDVPSSIYQVGWYKNGVKPGQKGKAVLDGHYGTPNQPGVFRKLDQLKPGDEVVVEDKATRQWRFVVKKVVPYNPAIAPLNDIFGSSDRAQLNLITCYGKWYATSFKYEQRLIVFTELIAD